MIGADPRRLDRAIQPLLPAYMTMGTNGMAIMAEMNMPLPRNSITMRGVKGPFGVMDVGGMFTIVKVREDPDAEDGSGWYEHPPGTVARAAGPAELRESGVDPAVVFGT
jgi:hypothetical protein